MATLTPATDTFVIIYSSVGKDKYTAQAYARAGQTTDIIPSDLLINTYTSFSGFNTALAALAQPSSSFNPFTDNQSPIV